MMNVLTPINEVDPDRLARGMYDVVGSSRMLLATRHILGPLVRYGGTLQEARGHISHLLDIQGDEQTSYAVTPDGDIDNIRGIATIMPDLKLRKLHGPIWPIAADFLPFLARSYEYASPNIQVVTAAGDEGVLAEAEAALVKIATPAVRLSTGNKVPWTIEPMQSPDSIHRAHLDAGLTRVASLRRFDDRESRKLIPPRSVLYAGIKSDWLTSHGRQMELRHGDRSLLQMLDDEHKNQYTNPR